MRFFWVATYLTAVVFFLSGCANIVTPTGGATDIMPPEVVSENPPSGTINFAGKSFEITFNEFVQITNPLQQVIISPPLENPPEFLLRRKTLEISWDETLKNNTTYSFNFSNAVADITEKNKLSNYVYVISTGAFIDSLYISGKVLNAFTLSPEENVLVMLYESENDSAPYVSRPDYFSRTDISGNFTINNIGNKIYKIFSLKDLNLNYKYDPGELIAFSHDAVSPLSEDSLILKMFAEERQELKVISSSFREGRLTAIFTKPAEGIDLLIFQPGNIQDISRTFSPTGDTLTTWIPGISPSDSLKILVSEGGETIDTLKLRAHATAVGKTFSFNVNMRRRGIAFNDTLILTSPAPLLTLDTSGIAIFSDTAFSVPVEFSLLVENQKDLKIVFPGEKPEEIFLKIAQGTATNIIQQTNDSLMFTVKFLSERDLGTMDLNFSAPERNYIVQLLQGNVLTREFYLSGSGIISFNSIYPGKYTLKAIEDNNGNRKWDTGNYLRGILPERVFISLDEITIRANWDLEMSWELKNN